MILVLYMLMIWLLNFTSFYVSLNIRVIVVRSFIIPDPDCNFPVFRWFKFTLKPPI